MPMRFFNCFAVLIVLSGAFTTVSSGQSDTAVFRNLARPSWLDKDKLLSIDEFSKSDAWASVVNSPSFKDMILDFAAPKDEDETKRGDQLASAMKALDLDTLTLIKVGSTPCARVNCFGFAEDFVSRLAGFIIDELGQAAYAAQAEAVNRGNDASRNIALGALIVSIISAGIAGTALARKWKG